MWFNNNKHQSAFFLVVATSAFLMTTTAGLSQPHESYVARFYDWMLQHNMHFPDGKEFRKRLHIWSLADGKLVKHACIHMIAKARTTTTTTITMDIKASSAPFKPLVPIIIYVMMKKR